MSLFVLERVQETRISLQRKVERQREREPGSLRNTQIPDGMVEAIRTPDNQL